MASSLLFGTLFVPAHSAQAGLVSSLSSLVMGDEALAQSEPSMLRPVLPGDSNSQNLSLLQANVSSAVILQEKIDEIPENTTEISGGSNLVSENALLPTVGTPGVLGENIDASLEDISVYVVRKGDAISQIAEMFNVSTNTILWANDMKKGDVLKEGDILVILPIDGVKHIVEKGQTLKSIAKKYNADVVDIASFNGISENSALAIGDELIIPDGEIYVDGPAVNTGTKSNNKTTTPAPTKNLSGYFVNPAPGAVKTQGLHGKNAVDLAAPVGTPILASASGTVLVARMGWNGGYGGMVIIQHPNGTKTLYSHLSSLNTSSGKSVSQGETIAYMGNTGNVRPSKGGTGSHLHFEVYGAKNPGVDKSWKR